jgi:hypothetical protein
MQGELINQGIKWQLTLGVWARSGRILMLTAYGLMPVLEQASPVAPVGGGEELPEQFFDILHIPADFVLYCSGAAHHLCNERRLVISPLIQQWL